MIFSRQNFSNKKPIVMYQTSFVQTRGSIPLFWKQDVDLAYEPPIVIDHNDDSPMRKHFAEQINLYNKNVLVNLVKKKGAEGPLGTVCIFFFIIFLLFFYFFYFYFYFYYYFYLFFLNYYYLFIYFIFIFYFLFIFFLFLLFII